MNDFVREDAGDSEDFSSPPAYRPRLWIVDPDSYAREGLRAVLDTRPEWDLLGDFDRLDAYTSVPTRAGGVAIVAAEVLREQFDQRVAELAARSVVLVTFRWFAAVEMERAFAHGARGVLTKDAPLEDWHRAIERLVRGEAFLPQRLQVRLLERVRDGVRPSKADPLARLSPREREVYAGLKAGRSTRELATELGVARSTVDAHVMHIRRKLGVNSLRELTTA